MIYIGDIYRANPASSHLFACDDHAYQSIGSWVAGPSCTLHCDMG